MNDAGFKWFEASVVVEMHRDDLVFRINLHVMPKRITLAVFNGLHTSQMRFDASHSLLKFLHPGLQAALATSKPANVFASTLKILEQFSHSECQL